MKIIEEDEKKICPFLSSSSAVDLVHCVEEKCAWWDEEGGICCLRFLSTINGNIRIFLSMLER